MAGIRVRADVWNLSVGSLEAAENEPWHPVLDAYARGVLAMKALDGRRDARSWEWAANTHGEPGVPPNPPSEPLWAQCEHATPFFLPWHRAYLRWFEQTIQHHIGDDDWALPYWDYTDPDRPETLELPPEFLVRRRLGPEGPEENPLYEERFGSPLANDVEIVAAMRERAYLRRRTYGFGGVLAASRYPGLLENEPHNFVHGDIGGIMGNPQTAGGDPIFWLHHANIDRLWEVWLGLDSASNPPDQPGVPASWIQGWTSASFAFGASDAPTTFSMADVEAIDQAPMSYRYESTALPVALEAAILAATVPPGGPMPLDADDDPDEGWEPVASVPDVDVAADAQQVDLELDGGAVLGLDGAVEPPTGLIVELGGVRGADPHHVYVVDVKAAPDAPTRRAGRFSTFSVARTTDDPDSSYQVDATDLVAQLLDDGWDGRTLTVQVGPDPERADLPSQEGSGVSIGQITLYIRR